jgi:hypothetical protein
MVNGWLIPEPLLTMSTIGRKNAQEGVLLTKTQRGYALF